MKIIMLCKYPPIQGGVSAEAYWTAQLLAEMDHQVYVLTNADEVEAEYRMQMDNEDYALLTGYRRLNSIRVVSTHKDRQHMYIPQNNPSVSKLVSTGVDLVNEFGPDFIYSHYVQPYGVAALYISMLTGVPYTIKHAGSDIGRLIKTSQLKTLYEHVFKQAICVLTGGKHKQLFLEDIGMNQDQIVSPASVSLPGDVFYPEKRTSKNRFVLGVYGKIGAAKGTTELLEAFSILQEEGFYLKALWNGQGMNEVISMLPKLNIRDENISINGFIPHWRVPKFIRSCDLILFLENNFRISFHTPSIPLESWSCGRHVLITGEIAEKDHLQ